MQRRVALPLLPLMVVAFVIGGFELREWWRSRDGRVAAGAAAAGAAPAAGAPEPGAAPWRPDPSSGTVATTLDELRPRGSAAHEKPPRECVRFTWSRSSVRGSAEDLLIDIEASNDCDTELPGTEVWFSVAGYRKGQLLHTVRAHLLDSLPAGEQAVATVALPRHPRGYDEIEVRGTRAPEI